MPQDNPALEVRGAHPVWPSLRSVGSLLCVMLLWPLGLSQSQAGKKLPLNTLSQRVAGRTGSEEADVGSKPAPHGVCGFGQVTYCPRVEGHGAGSLPAWCAPGVRVVCR